MLGKLADNVNISLDSINKNNSYFYYSCRRNTNSTFLNANTSSSYTPGNGIVTHHQMGSLFTVGTDPGDGKQTWTLDGASGLYACTASLNVQKNGLVNGQELIVEFRENDLFVANWYISIPEMSEYISSNIFLPLTSGNVYSVWIKCETMSGNVVVSNTEFTARPMLNTIPLLNF